MPAFEHFNLYNICDCGGTRLLWTELPCDF